MMAPLPQDRVTPSRAFTFTGRDYAGPVSLKSEFGRGTRAKKAWKALFISLSVKALHTELATTLSTDAFLAAFRRFVSRRGKPQVMYSHNGTNFVGANKDLQQLLRSKKLNEQTRSCAQRDNIHWHFMP